MRALLAALVLLAPALALTAHGEPSSLLTDARGDAALVARAGETVAPPLAGASTAQAESADLVSLDFAESDDGLALTVGVVAIQGASTGATYRIEFSWLSVPYRAEIDYYVFSQNSFQRATLLAQLDGAWSDVSPLPLLADAAAGKLTVELQKVTLLDATRLTPSKGDAITDLRVTALRAQDLRFDGVEAFVGYADAMPDDGKGVAYAFALGDEAAGHLRLLSDERVRVSNGGATTFVFHAHVRNEGAVDDDVTLDLVGLPA